MTRVKLVTDKRCISKTVCPVYPHGDKNTAKGQDKPNQYYRNTGNHLPGFLLNDNRL
jgi:hypothetical protein